MKITQRHANTKRFSDLEKGTVFKFVVGNHIYMKTERIETGDFECNIVDLTNGSLESTYETAMVVPLEHELMIG